jgi:glucose/arabinose dehydrogenase
MRLAAALAVAVAVLTSCTSDNSKSRTAETRREVVRQFVPQDILLPPGYEIAAVATGLSFPTGVAFDGEGRPHVVEAGNEWDEPRLVRVEPNGNTVVAKGQRNGPWNGAAFRDGRFYVAEGGSSKGGRILQIGMRGGQFKLLANGLPSRGDHQTTGPALGPDGRVYFGQGTATNAGVAGPDNAGRGWLSRYPTVHDVPCQDVVLAGRNFASEHVLSDFGGETQTGAFKPFGQPSHGGEVVTGGVPCNGAILRIAEGEDVQLVASGLRHPFGLAFDADGQLYATEHGFDPRGSREARGSDYLWAIKQGAWYGWPDFSGGKEPVAGGPVLARHPPRGPAPVADFGPQASPGGFDFSTSQYFGHVGEAFVALYGERMPGAGARAARGYKVVRVDVRSGRVEDFAVNRGGTAPASALRAWGLERPIAARFAPHGQALYVVDYGIVLDGEDGPEPQRGTGVLWRITRTAIPSDGT